MRLLIQRVLEASVTIDGELHSSINGGLLLFLGIEQSDNQEDIDYLIKKALKLRIFGDENGVMNLDINQIGGEILVVSQFTLHASTHKGNRPTYIKAAPESISRPMYNTFIESLHKEFSGKVATGSFGADMKVSLINDGPATIWIDSKERKY